MHDRRFWIIKRNCSASPRLLALVFASLVALSFMVGLAFAALGFWVVLPFVGLELLAVAVAFVAVGRHATDFERIEVGERQIEVERNEAARSTVLRLARPWARVELEGNGQAGWRATVRVYLAAGGERIEVGRLLTHDRRVELARELKVALQTPALA